MAEPFVFHFRPGPDGHPQAMYIADVQGECALCKHVQIQRFYHATPFHAATLRSLETIAQRAHEKASYECENCGTAVGPEHVREAALTWGFADDAGLVRIFVHRPQDATPSTQYQLVPGRRLDPQELPGWAPSEEHGVTIERLEDELVETHLQRPFNPKQAWLDILEDYGDDPEGGAWTRGGSGYWLMVEEDRASLASLVDAIDDPELDDAQEQLVLAMNDSVPEGLATHQAARTMPGHPQTWLPAPLVEAMQAEKFVAGACVLPSVIRDVMRRAFEVANLSFEEKASAKDTMFCRIATPGEVVYPRDVSVLSVAKRAVYTGITPGDAARLTAEEIVGVLLRVWTRPESIDEPTR